jgi:large subunit ribosomal protein L25
MKPGVLLQLEPRIPGKGLTQLRRQGEVPAILYGAGIPASPVAVPRGTLNAALNEGAEHHPCRIQQGAGGPSRLALVKEVQRGLLTGFPIHVDFQLVDQDKAIEVGVPIRFHGESELMQKGLLLHIQLHEIKAEAKPSDIPDFIEIDTTALKAGDTLTVGQLQVPAGLTVLEPATHLIFTVGHIRAQVEVVEQAAPSVIMHGAGGAATAAAFSVQAKPPGASPEAKKPE